VVLVPSPTVITPFANMPNVRSDVPGVSGALPVPVAGAAAEADELDVADPLEPPDEDDELPELLWDVLVLLEPPVTVSSALCTADAS
jgi:hypothetical protein